LKGILHVNHSFQGGKRLKLFQIGLLSCIEDTQVSPQRKPSMLEAAASRALFPSENWVSFSKEYILLRGFSIVLYSRVDEAHISLKRSIYVLAPLASSTLFFCDN
jgi:hypothetical protein